MKSIADIQAIREKMQSEIIMRDNKDVDEIKVVVGMGTCGLAAGSRSVYNALVDEVLTRNLRNVKISRSGCLGSCNCEPIVEVHEPNKEKVTYRRVTPEKVVDIVVNHLVGGKVCADYLLGDGE